MGGRTEQKEENAEKLEPLFEFQGNSFVVNSHNDDCKRLYRALYMKTLEFLSQFQEKG